jgi:hypothetical protein
LLEPGDLVLAEIKTFLDDSGKGALLVIFAKRSFYCDGVKETQTMIHIERIMQKLKRFHIMSKFRYLRYLFMCCDAPEQQNHIFKV